MGHSFAKEGQHEKALTGLLPSARCVPKAISPETVSDVPKATQLGRGGSLSWLTGASLFPGRVLMLEPSHRLPHPQTVPACPSFLAGALSGRTPAPGTLTGSEDPLPAWLPLSHGGAGQG